MNTTPGHTIVIALLLGLLSVFPASAATIVVDSTADGPPGDMGGACTLRSAIASATSAGGVDGCQSGTGGPDEVIFHPALAGATITLTQGQLNITTPMTITGPIDGDPAALMIDAAGQSRVIGISGQGDDEMPVTLRNLTLTGGQVSGQGGGINSQGDNVNLRIQDVRISGNTATNQGGGIFLAQGNAILERTTLAGNTSNNNGGGMAVNSNAFHILDSVIHGNTASGNGGGIFILFTSGAITNSTVSGNSATGATSNGGGITTSTAGLSLVHATIAFNTATGGGNGVHPIGGSINAINTVIAQADAAHTACGGTLSGTSGNRATDASCFGAGNTSTPAQLALGPLADNGGPTLTHMPAPGSTAVDAGGDCIGELALDSDQRGRPRPAAGSSGNACDAGAFELQRPAMAFTPGSLLFGIVPVGDTSAALAQTISVTGDAPLIVTDIHVTAPFALTSVDDCMSGLQFIVQPGDSCNITFTFTPASPDPVVQDVTLESNNAGGSDSFRLYGQLEAVIFDDRYEASM